MEVFCRKVLIHGFFLFFAQSIDCGYKLEPPRRGEAVLTSTHNLCFGAKIRRVGSNEYPQSMFGAKIRKMGIPLHTPVLLYENGV